MKPSGEDLMDYAVRADVLWACLSEIEGALATRGRCAWLACLNPHSVSGIRPLRPSCGGLVRFDSAQRWTQ